MSRDEKGMRQTGLRSSGEEEARQEAERKMMEDLDKMSKSKYRKNVDQASLDMIHNSNNILQKQNEILYENQRTIQQMVKQ